MDTLRFQKSIGKNLPGQKQTNSNNKTTTGHLCFARVEEVNQCSAPSVLNSDHTHTHTHTILFFSLIAASPHTLFIPSLFLPFLTFCPELEQLSFTLTMEAGGSVDVAQLVEGISDPSPAGGNDQTEELFQRRFGFRL